MCSKRAIAAARPSDTDGFAERNGAQGLAEPGFRHDVDVASEQGLELHFEPRQVEQGPAWFQPNEKIDIAVAAFLASRY